MKHIKIFNERYIVQDLDTQFIEFCKSVSDMGKKFESFTKSFDGITLC